MQSQSCSLVPLAVPPPGMSRHLPSACRVVLASTYQAADAVPDPAALTYGRWANPTWTAFERALGPRTRLVAVGAASNALGTITDVARAAELARAAGEPLLETIRGVGFRLTAGGAGGERAPLP